MARNKKYTEDDLQIIIDAIHDSHGMLNYTASKLGVTYRTLHNYFKEWPILKEEWLLTMDKFKDIALSNIKREILNGDPEWSMRFLEKFVFNENSDYFKIIINNAANSENGVRIILPDDCVIDLPKPPEHNLKLE